jgi:regulatory protein
VQTGSPFDCSLRILALRDHSEFELRTKLRQKGYEESGIAECLTRLRELGYLDDARFARHFASSAIRNGRGYGTRLKLELARRGVESGIISETLSELSDEFSERDVLGDLVARRFSGFDPERATEKERRRVVGYLQRKGFSLSAIMQQLKGWERD